MKYYKMKMTKKIFKVSKTFAMDGEKIATESKKGKNQFN